MSDIVFSLAGKRILLTGATSGIGKCTALELSKRGANLVIFGRNKEKLEKTLSTLDTSYSQHHEFFSIDMMDKGAIEELKFGDKKFDGAVMAAGINKIVPFSFLSYDIADEIMQSNFFGNIMLLNNVVRKKLFNKGGSIIFVSSINGTIVGSKGHTAYAASKGAINGFMRSLANELSRSQIRVNSICPGLIETGMFQQNMNASSASEIQEYVKRYPLGIGKPEDVAYSCIYLLSDASRWLTGQTIVLDGGISINN